MEIAIRQERSGPVRCPFCRVALATADLRLTCRECGVDHHRACWSESARCAACGHPLARDGLGGFVAGAVDAEPEPSTWTPRVAPRSWWRRLWSFLSGRRGA